jgi:hypothetical protein
VATNSAVLPEVSQYVVATGAGGRQVVRPVAARAIGELLVHGDRFGDEQLGLLGSVVALARLELTGLQHDLVEAVEPEGWADRVDIRPTKENAVLVRPGGTVVWAGGPGLREALATWFGEPITKGS